MGTRAVRGDPTGSTGKLARSTQFRDTLPANSMIKGTTQNLMDDLLGQVFYGFDNDGPGKCTCIFVGYDIKLDYGTTEGYCNATHFGTGEAAHYSWGTYTGVTDGMQEYTGGSSCGNGHSSSSLTVVSNSSLAYPNYTVVVTEPKTCEYSVVLTVAPEYLSPWTR